MSPCPPFIAPDYRVRMMPSVGEPWRHLVISNTLGTMCRRWRYKKDEYFTPWPAKVPVSTDQGDWVYYVTSPQAGNNTHNLLMNIYMFYNSYWGSWWWYTETSESMLRRVRWQSSLCPVAMDGRMPLWWHLETYSSIEGYFNTSGDMYHDGPKRKCTARPTGSSDPRFRRRINLRKLVAYPVYGNQMYHDQQSTSFWEENPAPIRGGTNYWAVGEEDYHDGGTVADTRVNRLLKFPSHPSLFPLTMEGRAAHAVFVWPAAYNTWGGATYAKWDIRTRVISPMPDGLFYDVAGVVVCTEDHVSTSGEFYPEKWQDVTQLVYEYADDTYKIPFLEDYVGDGDVGGWLCSSSPLFSDPPASVVYVTPSPGVATVWNKNISRTAYTDISALTPQIMFHPDSFTKPADGDLVDYGTKYPTWCGDPISR